MFGGGTSGSIGDPLASRGIGGIPPVSVLNSAVVSYSKSSAPLLKAHERLTSSGVFAYRYLHQCQIAILGYHELIKGNTVD